MREIATGAQHDLDRVSKPGGGENLGYHVVPRRTRAGEQGRPALQLPLIEESPRYVHRAFQKRTNRRFVVEHALVNLNTGQSNRLPPAIQGRQYRGELLVIAHASTAAHHSNLKQHLQAGFDPGKECAKPVDLLGRIYQAIKFESRVLQHTANDRHVFLADELVRHQHASHTMGIGDLCLGCGCQRNSPGSRPELHFKEPWRHGGLAVRRQMNAIGIDESLHPVEIVLKAILVENGSGQAQILTQKVPAELRDFAGTIG